MPALGFFAPRFAAEAAPTIFIALAALTIVFGIGVVVVGRRRSAKVKDAGFATQVGAPTVAPAEKPAEQPAEKPSVRERLVKARSSLSGAIATALTRSSITDSTWDELEESLLRADLGVATTTRVLQPLRKLVASKTVTEPGELMTALKNEMRGQLGRVSRELRFDDSLQAPNIWLVVGVNGSGKTTTIGKLGAQQRKLGRSVLMAAGDTFRAAAGDQLQTWAQRSGAEFVRGAQGGDPSSVIFDGIARATARKIDLVLADTAGRLQNNNNLMDELSKVRRVADKGEGEVTEVLLVIDATTGQNGLNQAKQFSEATQVTGVVLTKLDGSSKGGIVFAIETELGIPIKLVGLGETIDDLVEFDADEFVDALFV